MPSRKPNRRSRKRRQEGRAPRAVVSPRREQRAEQRQDAARAERAARRSTGTVGERPPGPFGNVPVSEIAIFAGLVAIVVWLLIGAGILTLVVGMVVLAGGVLEVTAREHFSGFRSHTTLLAAIPSLAVGIGVVSLIGNRRDRAPLLVVIAGPLFALLVWLLRRRFLAARQTRVVRPPAP